MRLYKMELYKLCHKKFFYTGTVFIIAFVLLYFFQTLHTAVSTVDGIVYRGYAAVKTDRRITEEFHGPLTGETVQRIVDRYGLPDPDTDNATFQNSSDSNFLNRFAMTYGTDNTSAVQTGNDIWLDYYDGWSMFTSMYFMEMIMVSVLLLCMLTPVFSIEILTRTKPLLFTTQNGPEKDTRAKIAAAFTITIGLWSAITALSLLLTGAVYGWEGLRCPAFLVEFYGAPGYAYGFYLIISLLLSLLGVLELCAIALAFSAYCRSPFHAAALTAACYMMPILCLTLLRTLYQILSVSGLSYSALFLWSRVLFCFHCLFIATPFFLSHQDIVVEIGAISNRTVYGPLLIVIFYACMTILMCTAAAYRKYRKTFPASSAQ